MAVITDEFKDFMAKLFASQEVQRQKEHKEFKEDIQDMIKAGIKQEVEKATQSLKESQEKIERDQAELLKTVEELTKKVGDIERDKTKESEYPRLAKPREISLEKMYDVSAERTVDPESITKDQKYVRSLFKRSNLTLGLSPISKEFVEAEVAKQRDEGGESDEIIKTKVMKEAVKEFLIMEMKVKEEHFHKLDIVRIFTPQKTDWQMLYVQFESQDQVDWLLGHTRWIPEAEGGQGQSIVVKYIPKQLYKRWNALQAKAFTIRKESNWTIKTKVGHGRDDFFLQTRPKGEKIWSEDKKLPDDLPTVELEFLTREERSPASAPGRDIYKRTERTDKRKQRPSSSGSSSSSSPPQKQLSTERGGPVELDPGILARPDIRKVVDLGHPPGSAGQGIQNPEMFNHFDAAFVSSRKK